MNFQKATMYFIFQVSSNRKNETILGYFHFFFAFHPCQCWSNRVGVVLCRMFCSSSSLLHCSGCYLRNSGCTSSYPSCTRVQHCLRRMHEGLRSCVSRTDTLKKKLSYLSFLKFAKFKACILNNLSHVIRE